MLHNMAIMCLDTNILIAIEKPGIGDYTKNTSQMIQPMAQLSFDAGLQLVPFLFVLSVDPLGYGSPGLEWLVLCFFA